MLIPPIRHIEFLPGFLMMASYRQSIRLSPDARRDARLTMEEEEEGRRKGRKEEEEESARSAQAMVFTVYFDAAMPTKKCQHLIICLDSAISSPASYNFAISAYQEARSRHDAVGLR